MASKHSLISYIDKLFLTVLESGKQKITVPEPDQDFYHAIIWWEVTSDVLFLEKKKKC